jgi:predicted MFS family arabinose efflux permease
MAARKKYLGIIFLTLFLDLVGFSIVFPLFRDLLAMYQDQVQVLMTVFPDIGADLDQRLALIGGLLFSIYSLAQFVSARFWGALSDRIGRRPVLLITLSMALLGNLIWVVSGNLWVFLLARLVSGFGAGNVSVLTAAAADVTGAAKRTSAMAIVGMAFGLGFTVGPAIGALSYIFLPQAVLTGAALSLHTFSACALVTVVLGLINLLWVWRGFPETRTPTSDNELKSLEPDCTLRHLTWAYAAYIIAFSIMEATLVFLIAQRVPGTSPGVIGWLFVYMGVVSALLQGGLIRRLSGQINERVLATVGLIAFVPGMLWFAWADSLADMFIGMLGPVLAMACVMPALSAWVSKVTDADHQGAALGYFRSRGSLARAVGPAMGGFAFFVLGSAETYVLAAITMLIPLILIVITKVPPASLQVAQETES